MRILALSYLFPNPKQPHDGIFVYNRLKAIAKIHEVHVIAPIPWFPFRHRLASYQDLRNIPFTERHGGLIIYHPRFFVIPAIFKWFDPFSYFICVLPLLLCLIRNKNYDIIDVHWVYPDILTGLIISLITRRPFLITIRGKEALFNGECSLRKKLLNLWLRKADGVICLSSELAEMARDIGVLQNKLYVIPNGVDINTFYPLDQKECRQKLELAHGCKIILSVGYLIERKGFHHLLKCMPSLIAGNPNIFLYIVGSPGAEGNYESLLRDLIQKLGLKDHVFIIHARPNDELPLWYNAADIFCLVTSGEGSPNVVMEALACGCPVIASAVGGIPDIIIEEFLGKMIDPNDIINIQETLNDALKKDWDRARIRQYIINKSWQWCANNVVTIYKKLSNNSGYDYMMSVKDI